MDHLCYLCLVFVMRLFIAALWSPAGKGLTCWLLFVMFNCVFFTFPCSNLGQVWYLIISIPDLCHLFYFDWLHSGSSSGFRLIWPYMAYNRFVCFITFSFILI